jgi:hypothetical protein
VHAIDDIEAVTLFLGEGRRKSEEVVVELTKRSFEEELSFR